MSKIDENTISPEPTIPNADVTQATPPERNPNEITTHPSPAAEMFGDPYGGDDGGGDGLARVASKL